MRRFAAGHRRQLHRKGAAGAADRAGPDLCRRPQAGHPAFLLRAGVFLRLCQQQQPDGRKTPRRSSGRDRESSPENHPITRVTEERKDPDTHQEYQDLKISYYNFNGTIHQNEPAAYCILAPVRCDPSRKRWT